MEFCGVRSFNKYGVGGIGLGISGKYDDTAMEGIEFRCCPPNKIRNKCKILLSSFHNFLFLIPINVDFIKAPKLFFEQ